MKITLEHYDNKVSVETKHEDLTTYELLDLFRGLMVTAGYSEFNIIESFQDLYNEHEFKLNKPPQNP